MWQWSGGGGTFNGHGDFDQIDANLIPKPRVAVLSRPGS
jgi:hypothetical protein